MTEEQQQELKELINQLYNISEEYNKKAAEYGDYTRVGYVFADHNRRVKRIKNDGEEVGVDWEPDWDVAYTDPTAPGAEGWFPSSFQC